MQALTAGGRSRGIQHANLQQLKTLSPILSRKENSCFLAAGRLLHVYCCLGDATCGLCRVSTSGEFISSEQQLAFSSSSFL